MTVHREQDGNVGFSTMDPVAMRGASAFKQSGDLFAHDSVRWVHIWPKGGLLPVTHLRFTGVSQTELDAAWTIPTEPLSVTAVWVRIPEVTTVWTVLAANTTSHAFTGLTANTRYTVQVRVVHTDGDGTVSSPIAGISGTTLHTITPPSPISTTTWTIPPAPPDVSTPGATTPGPVNGGCHTTWWHWTFFDFTAATVLAEGDASGLGAILTIGTYIVDTSHVYEMCYHTVTDDCHGNLVAGPDTCTFLNLASSGGAVFTSVAYTAGAGMVDIVDENTVTVPGTYRAVLIASSQTASHTQAGAWPRSPNTSNDVAALAYFIAGNPGDTGYGTANTWRVFEQTGAGWPTFYAACLLPNGKVLALVMIRTGYDLGDGVTLANGFYLVLFGRPGTITGFTPETVVPLTYVATSGASAQADFDNVSAKLVRTAADAATLVLHIENRKPGAWTLGAVTTTVGRAPGSVSDLTAQSNLLMFELTPSTVTVLNGTGYGVTPANNLASSGVSHWNMNVEVDPATGYFWFTLSAAMTPSLGARYDTLTFDAQTLTFTLTDTYPVAVAWDPVTRTVVKMVTITANLASCLAGLGSAPDFTVLALNRHGGVTRMLLVGWATTTPAATVYTFGGQSVTVNDAVNTHLLAGIYNVTTDTVEHLVDVPAVDPALVNQSVQGFPYWTGSQWVVNSQWAITETGTVTNGPLGTFLSSVYDTGSISAPAQAQATDGPPTSVTPGQGVWVVSRVPTGGGTGHLYVSLVHE